MFKPRKKVEAQGEFWVAANRLPQASPSRFHELLNQTLERMNFPEQVRTICAPAYADEAKGGRPGIDPVVYFKMLMVGFFEGLESEREIASRCADSLSLRGFLGYPLEEATPEHSSMSVIRLRLGAECFQAVFALVLKALHEHGLLKGRHLGIDSSVIEANASLRSLKKRSTEESYWEYVQRLAKEAGLETEDAAALRRFDQKRSGRKTSNEEWQNPHDPEAKIGRTKDGATDMVYLPEHTVELETGAIIQAQVLAGDHRDSEDLSARAIEAAVSVQEAQQDENLLPRTLTGDKGFFSLKEVGLLHELSIKTVIPDPHSSRRNLNKLTRCAAPCSWSGATIRAQPSMAGGCCANAESTLSAALPMCSMPEGCAGPPCGDSKISTNATRSPQPATTSPSSCAASMEWEPRSSGSRGLVGLSQAF